MSCVIVLLVSAAAVSPGRAEERELKSIKTVVVDPGHGGDNKGALGYNGTFEKDIVLQVALKLKELLEAQTTAGVSLTREDDRSLANKDRVAFANEAQADLFISLHCNSSYNPKPTGIETFVLSEAALREESDKLSRQVVQPKGLYASAADNAAAAVVKEMMQFAAQRDAKSFGDLLQGSLVRRTKAVNRGVKELPIVILRGAEMPGVVVELGFVSNPLEAENLGSAAYQERIAQAIVDAVIRFDQGKDGQGGARGDVVGR